MSAIRATRKAVARATQRHAMTTTPIRRSALLERAIVRQRLVSKLEQVDRLPVATQFSTGSVSAWIESVLDAFISNARKDRRNARDRARRAQQRKGGPR